ncbi:hypothetical protein OF83DRAFT_1176969 [Amylostereum chailletii]|nr:hypothetical protein OF83DRAFT_1176969 [Amylostereum chailletii]
MARYWDKSAATNPTAMLLLEIIPDLLYMMGNISALMNTRWYLGLPFYVTDPFALEIVEQGQAILGDTLLGFQAGNKPNLYADHNHRNAIRSLILSYSQFDYFGEISDLVTQIGQDANIKSPNDLILVPTASLRSQSNSQCRGCLHAVPPLENNCAALYSTGGPVLDPQTEFPNYLNHTSAQTLVGPYINSTAYAQSVGKEFLMFETNTASCSGSPGSRALPHQRAYNPFTPPPTNQSTFRQWTVGPVYYAALVMAEALGPSNKSHLMDLSMNTENMFTPGYVIYEDGQGFPSFRTIPVRPAPSRKVPSPACTRQTVSARASHAATASVAFIRKANSNPDTATQEIRTGEPVCTR